MPSSSSTPSTRVPSLLSLLADSGGRHAAIGLLHTRALELTGALCSILFEQAPGGTALQVTSGAGVDRLPTEAWHPTLRESGVISQAFGSRAITIVRSVLAEMPNLHARLRTDQALLVPLVASSRRVGLLALGLPVGFAERAASTLESSDVPAGLLVALELSRLRQHEELEAEARQVICAFSDRLSASLALAPALEAMCVAATRVFGADRATVWALQRDTRTLSAVASSDPNYRAGVTSVRVDDPLAPAASALRMQQSGLASTAHAATSTLTVPLRGCRRALGGLIFEGVRIEPGDDLTILNRADELGRQLSASVETVQLLGSVMQSRRELEQLFNSIAHIIVVIDPDGCIARVNPAFAAAAGRSPDQLIQRPFSECVGTELSQFVNGLQHPLASPVLREIKDSVLGGPYTVTVTDLITDSTRHAGRVVVARNIPSVHAGEMEKPRLKQTATLAALGEFVAGVAHELNNPLQSVLGHLELLHATGAVPEAIRADIRAVARDADRAARVVRHLLVFAGAGRLQRRAAGINGILQRVLALRKASCRSKHIEVVRHYEEHLPRILVDPILLHQVFLNIVMNAEHAVAATKRPGRIEISTGLGSTGDWLTASIRDNGAGIDDRTISRVFEPFYTTKDVGQGAGLGLALAYGIVHEHGGRITAANHPEGGAVFTVELPTTWPA
ncbi:MAG: ATP-binding protein [Vicinamibacterales bacterium]